ncbi:DUF4352 domain-containing protein [Nesterenkonia muleiensis]|uniref:DUF4352 domain-containing protein n=1 Tax=Nesterenkonia muleiensis TaxID=2282648 RepID=UPI000E772B2F|nr:DUF4352 domain-containing protein [Nesterenkonia muleiensis]
MSSPVAETTTEKRTHHRNVVGIIALITAVVGAIFAGVPGALIIGWVLLPIAFILSLVSLFLKGRKRGNGIAALIITVVGSIIGVIVFFTVVADAFDEALSDETTASVPSEEGTADEDDQDGESGEERETAADDEDAGDASAADEELGSRANPYPLGTEVSSSDWSVTINSVDLDATDEVLAENQFNEEPEEGHHYMLVNVTAEYTGDDAQGATPMLSIAYVSPQGNTYNSYDKSAVEPDSFDSLTTLYEAASVTGNIAIHVPSDDVETGVLSVTPDLLSDRVFVAVD